MFTVSGGETCRDDRHVVYKYMFKSGKANITYILQKKDLSLIWLELAFLGT